MALTEKLTAIADSIRGKTGKTEGLTLEQMASEIAGMEIGGGGDNSELVKSLVEGSAVNLAFGEDITTVKERLFENVTSLKSFDFTHIKDIKDEAFKGCTGLTELYLPSLNSPLGQGARAFQNCTGIKKVSLPHMPYWYSSAPGWFSGCSSLTDVYAPELTDPSLAFRQCTSLEKLDFPKLVNVNADDFVGCSKLSTLILKNTTMVNLKGTNAFTGTPFASGGTGGTVYVPQALISQYQQATNWSTLYAAGTCNFVAIEGSEYE